jgi:arylsulfatase A-like enzyme
MRLLSWISLVLSLVSCTSKDSENHDASAPPNIIMFLADDQGWGDLSMNGNTDVSTPNIDQLATQGASFTHFYVSPVCSPTRSEMLTGRYHPRSGVYATSRGGERIDLDETTIAEVFKQAGYTTGAFGKWHNGMQPPYHPNARGFDEFYGFCSGHWGNYFSPPLEHNGGLVKGNGYVTDDFTEKALQFIEAHQEQPFFAYLSYNTPHSPMQVHDRWWKKFDGNPLLNHHRDPEKENLQHTRAALAMTENIDWNVGRVLARVEELGLTENTIIIYFTDNGPNGWRWNGGMKGRKGSTDEGGVRSPLLVQWPGTIDSGLEIDQIAAAIDLLPTLAELAGISYQTNKPLDGVSLNPLLEGEKADWPDRYLISHWRGRTSVRSQQYRLDHDGKLFDMVADPGQYTDISAKLPEVTDMLLTAREAWATDVLSEVVEEDTRGFPLGHPDYPYTQLPARDAIAHEGIKRSNRFPNDSFLTNWTSREDEITWDVEVLADGTFEVVLYYTCPAADVGSTFELRFGDSVLTGQITQAHDPPLTGMEHDRDERIESYVKDFKPLNLGTIDLKRGTGTLSLKALDIPGSQVMDFKLMMFRRVGS